MSRTNCRQCCYCGKAEQRSKLLIGCMGLILQTERYSKGFGWRQGLCRIAAYERVKSARPSSRSCGSRQWNVKKTVVVLSLFLVVELVYQKSPVHYVEDSKYSLLMDEAILHQGTPNMLSYQVPRGTGPGFAANGYSRNLALVKGRLIYGFPWGLPILTLPWVAVANALGQTVAPRHVYSAAKEVRMQRLATAFLSALTVCVAYEAAASLLPLSWSLTIALSIGFGTQMWSSVSRSLWPQTWYLLLITLIILLLMRGWHWPWLLATLIAWAAFVRPVAAPTLLILGVYILFELESQQARVLYLATGLLWAGALGAVMLFFVGQLLAPVYDPGLMVITGFLGRLVGILFSPARGLLVYVPVVLVPLYLTVRHWRQLPQRRLAALALAAVFSTIATLACCRVWWGGWSYGPRDLVETVPWLALLAISGIKTFWDDSEITRNGRRIFTGAATLLLAASIMMNAPGALSRAAGFEWNARPDVDTHPDRLWDWRHPQFLAWIQRTN